MTFDDIQRIIEDLQEDLGWQHHPTGESPFCDMHGTRHPDGADHDAADFSQQVAVREQQPTGIPESQEEAMLYSALNRSTNEIDSDSPAEAAQWLNNNAATPEQLQGVNTNLKGIYGEMRVVDILNSRNDGITYELAHATNNPGVDVYGYDAHGRVVKEIQVKMSDSESYIRESTSHLAPHVEVIVPDEMGHLPGVTTIGIKLSDIESDTNQFLDELTAYRRAMLPPGFREFAQNRLRQGY